MCTVQRCTLLFLSITSCLTSTALAQPRPFLFSMGRYTAAWAGRPQSYDQQLWDHMVTIGATMNGSGLAWCDGEPTQGQYSQSAFDYADFEVNQMRARGIEPTFFLGLTPAWAALRPDLPPHQTPPAEAYVQQFMDFHRYVANHFKGRVKYYYFWNEPNGCSWINVGCSNSDSYPLYTKWMIRCSQAVKEADPSAKIIAANLDYHSGVTNGYQYIEGMYNEGAGSYFDIISIHPYDWAGTIHWKAITDTRNVMVAHGDAAKPIWLSEFGWNSTDYALTATKLTQVLTELKKSQWSYVQMAQYLVLNDGSGVENYGLMDANLNPRAGYYAFRDFDKSWSDYVDFQADVTSGVAPLPVQFTDLSYVAGASSWAWDFGDGQTSTTRNPSHTYANAGTYTVRLTVTGTAGAMTATKTNYITVTIGVVDFTANTTVGPAPLAVQFTDITTISNVTSWAWDFGDGQTSALRHPLHTYAAEGIFTVRLTVTTTGGQQTVEKPSYIRVGSFSRIAFLAETAPLNAADTDIIAHLRSLNIFVDVYDDEAVNRPAASVIATTHDLVIVSSTVLSAEVAGQFRNQTVPMIYWESSLSLNGRESLAGGAGITSNSTQIDVLNNTHPVMAGVNLGTVTVANAGSDFSRSSGPIGTGVTVLATQVGETSKRMVMVAEPGAALLDGGVAAGKRVFLFLYDTTWPNLNDTGKKIFDNAVVYGLGTPSPEFTADPTMVRTGEPVQFTDASTGPVVSWVWDFGDQTTSTIRSPAHAYSLPGTYTVKLTVTGVGGGLLSRTRDGYITVKPRLSPNLDGDLDVDADDVQILQNCMTGPNALYAQTGLPPGCTLPGDPNGKIAADLDYDGDVDMEDFGLLQACLSEPEQPPTPECGN